MKCRRRERDMTFPYTTKKTQTSPAGLEPGPSGCQPSMLHPWPQRLMLKTILKMCLYWVSLYYNSTVLQLWCSSYSKTQMSLLPELKRVMMVPSNYSLSLNVLIDIMTSFSWLNYRTHNCTHMKYVLLLLSVVFREKSEPNLTCQHLIPFLLFETWRMV